MIYVLLVPTLQIRKGGVDKSLNDVYTVLEKESCEDT